MQIVECVPNFSEGARPEVISQIVDAAASVAGISILDKHSDAVHNRTVLTFVGAPRACLEAAFRLAERAAQLIDLRTHQGEHPRMGATDVIPFIPVANVTMDECVALATQLAERMGTELNIPVYLYARAARRPERVRLPDVRRGEFEGIRDTIQTDPNRAPDFGPPAMGPAGATAVGARPFLVAYNVNLNTSDLNLAKSIARDIRESSGGLPAVQARGMATDDPSVVQVSMNLLDTSVTPLHTVFATVAAMAARGGASVKDSEVVGLLPLSVLVQSFVQATGAHAFHTQQVIESAVLTSVLDSASKRP